MPYIYSTSTNSFLYQLRAEAPKGGVGVVIASVLIKGGANVADKRTLITPKGVPTVVTDEELEILERVPSFRRHRDRGFLVVEKHEAKLEDVVSNMEPKDGAAPLTKEDFENPPKVAGETPELEPQASATQRQPRQRMQRPATTE